MSETRGVLGLEDILHDEEGTKRRAVNVDTTASDGRPSVPPRSFRDIRPQAVAQREQREQAGEALVARRPPALRLRYQTLLYLESQHRIDLDFGYLIALACQILEAEMSGLLLEPAGPLARHLVQIVRGAGKVRQAEVLDAWAGGRPPTIGTASLVLMALRQGLEAGDAQCLGFLESCFHPPYRALVASRELGPCLDRVREEFRNPACHGYGAFDRDAYFEFSRLMVARRRFLEWLDSGPESLPLTGCAGLLHCHLVESRRRDQSPPSAAAPTPLERLLALGRPRGSRLRVGVTPHRVGPPGDEADAAATSSNPREPFRVGDKICFHVTAGQDCQVALIDVGTSGNPAVILPNAWEGRVCVPAGQRLRVPPAGRNDYELALTPPAGRERVVALAWRAEPAVPLRPEGADAFRPLTSAEVFQLCDAIQRLADDEWAACVCDFEVLPP